MAMKQLTAALLLMALAANAPAEIYKCVNPASGETEFRDSPCAAGQQEEAVPDSVLNEAGRYSKLETRVLQSIMIDDREEVRTLCNEKFAGTALSVQERDERCEAALRRISQCKVDLAKMMPPGVRDTFFTRMSAGATEAEAWKASEPMELWGTMPPDQILATVERTEQFIAACEETMFD